MLSSIQQSNRSKRALFLALGLLLSLACLIVSLCLLDGTAPLSLRLGFALANSPNMIFFWLFVRTLFEDHFSIGPTDLIVGLIYILLMVWERFADNGLILLPRSIEIIVGIFSLGLILHLIYLLLVGRPTDLVADRRNTRLWLVGALIASASLSIAANNGVGLITESLSKLLSVSSIFLATVLMATWLIRLDIDLLEFEKVSKDHSDHQLNAREREQYRKLSVHMEKDLAFLNPKLTIVTLARSVGLGEHTLRALINKRLGFRNYTDFVNQYRIAYAKEKLTDDGTSHLPILTIALDSGYNSLSAFNRAFKLIEGSTPSEYRKRNPLKGKPQQRQRQ